MGSLINEDQVKTVSAHVDDAVAKGATVVAGGRPRPDLGPLFYEPTVLTDVPEDAECYADETFGPLVSVYPVDDVEDAIRRANDTEYGLNASVWARTKAEGEAIAARIHAAPSTSTKGTRRPGVVPTPRWEAWVSPAWAGDTVPTVCSSTRRRRPSQRRACSTWTVPEVCRRRHGRRCWRRSSPR